MRTLTRPAPPLHVLKRFYPIVLALLIAVVLAFLFQQVVLLIQSQRTTQTVARISQGYEQPIDLEDDLYVLFSQAQQYRFREQLDDATLLTETIYLRAKKTTEKSLAADALYNLANARLRQGISWLEQGRLERATQPLLLARDYYTRTLSLTPEHWDARYNLDITARMVRQLPRQPIQEEDEATEIEKPEELWSEVPGVPRGLP